MVFVWCYVLVDLQNCVWKVSLGVPLIHKVIGPSINFKLTLVVNSFSCFSGKLNQIVLCECDSWSNRKRFTIKTYRSCVFQSDSYLA